MNSIQQAIAVLVNERSIALHTGDTMGAMASRTLLMLLWSQLPDHTPDLKPSVSYGGIAYVLQSAKNGNYRYVKNSAYDDEGFVYVPTDRHTRILMELHMNNAALYEIAELKAKGEDPIAEDAEAEIA